MPISAENRKSVILEVCGLPESLLDVKANGINYSTFMNGLKKADVTLNRKMLSEIAIHDAAAFTALVEKAKAAL